METQPASRNALVVFTFTAIVIGAWAMAESWSDVARVPDFSPRAGTSPVEAPVQPVAMPGAPIARLEPVAPKIDAAPPVQPLAVKETLSPNEAVAAPAPMRTAPAKAKAGTQREATKPRKATPLRKASAPRKAAPARKAQAQRKAAVTRRAAPAPRKAPAPESTRHSHIVVEGRRPPSDATVRAEVIGAIAATPNISGRIGVEARDARVRLSGYTATASQASRAGRAAATVRGVRSVRNDIRPRVGGPD